MIVKKTILLKTLEDAHTRMCEGESALSRTCRHLHIAEKYPQALNPSIVFYLSQCHSEQEEEYNL